MGDTDIMDRVLKTQERIFGVPMTPDGPAAEAPPEPPRRRVRLNAEDEEGDDGAFRGFERGKW